MSINDNIKNELFKKGLNAFKKHHFYDAHEYWEDLWSDYKLVDAKFIQGLIQLAVGYFHISNSNKNGAQSLFNKCLPKLIEYKTNNRGINVDNIVIGVNSTLKYLSKIDDLKQFDWGLVPDIDNEL